LPIRRHEFHAKARSREVPMREGQFSPMALGLHGGSFSRQRPSRAKAAVRQAGPVVCMQHPCWGPRLPLLSAARGPGRPSCFVVFRASARAGSRMGARACVGWLPGGPVGQRSRISRESGKPRRSDERKTIFRLRHRATPEEPVLDKGHPERQPSFARRARLPGKR